MNNNYGSAPKCIQSGWWGIQRAQAEGVLPLDILGYGNGHSRPGSGKEPVRPAAAKYPSRRAAQASAEVCVVHLGCHAKRTLTLPRARILPGNIYLGTQATKPPWILHISTLCPTSAQHHLHTTCLLHTARHAAAARGPE